MSKSEKLKRLIMEKISGFLIIENAKPAVIDIRVHYNHTVGRLLIEDDEIAKVMEEAEE